MEEEKMLSNFSKIELVELKDLFDNKDLQSFAFKIFKKIKKKEELITIVGENAYYNQISSSVAEGMEGLYSELKQQSIDDIIDTMSKLIKGLMVDFDSMLIEKAIYHRLKGDN